MVNIMDNVMDVMDELMWWLRCKFSYCLFRLNEYFNEIGLIKKNNT